MNRWGFSPMGLSPRGPLLCVLSLFLRRFLLDYSTAGLFAHPLTTSSVGVFSSIRRVHLHDVDSPTAIVEKRGIQRSIVVEVEKRGEVLDCNLPTSFGVHLLHEYPKIIFTRLSFACSMCANALGTKFIPNMI